MMTPEQKTQLVQIAQVHISRAFSAIKKRTEQDKKDIVAYYLYLVDDFFATANAAITQQDKEIFEQVIDKKATILEAIWDGKCELYDDELTYHINSDNWLENQSEFYQFAYKMIDNIEDEEQYEQIRQDYEACLIQALQKCDQDGIFGNRDQNGIIVFAFYIDDFDGNGEKSLLYRSSNALNSPDTYDKL